MTYPGGKAGAGVYQAIINQMPPHRRYVEPFVGGGAILLAKRPAEETHIADLDGEVLTAIYDVARRRGLNVQAHETCGIALMQNLQGRRDDLVYCDPPYVFSTRTKKRIYSHEMTDADHSRLLDAVTRLDCMVMLSGYDSLIYRAALHDWRLVTYTGQTRGGPREECLWCNFPEPVALHDYRYLGDGYRERERIRRKVGRWQSNFAGLPDLERRAVLSALLSIETAVIDHASPDPAGEDSALLILSNKKHDVECPAADSGTAGHDGGSSGGLSPSPSTNGAAGDDELGERPRHEGGFPQSGPIAASGDAGHPE